MRHWRFCGQGIVDRCLPVILSSWKWLIRVTCYSVAGVVSFHAVCEHDKRRKITWKLKIAGYIWWTSDSSKETANDSLAIETDVIIRQAYLFFSSSFPPTPPLLPPPLPPQLCLSATLETKCSTFLLIGWFPFKV